MMPQQADAAPSPKAALLIDIFCQVIDNFGDVGVTWRLARAWHRRGQRVRLWIDDASALSWMAMESADARQAIEILPFAQAGSGEAHAAVGDVVIEAFGCALPTPFIAKMACRDRVPVWINLEYLSAEDHARRNHGLPSPQHHGVAAGLVKWFYYPGFVEGTGGLASIEQALPFDGPGLGLGSTEARKVLLFTYPQAPLAALFDTLNSRPTLLLLAQGPSFNAAKSLLQATPNRWPRLSWAELPWMDQRRFDGVIEACDMNVVRGEDSLISALRAGKPLIWHAYPQSDAAHHAKVRALLDVLRLPSPMAQAWLGFNGMVEGPLPNLDDTIDAMNDRATAESQPSGQKPWLLPSTCSLADELIRFARGRRQALG